MYIIKKENRVCYNIVHDQTRMRAARYARSRTTLHTNAGPTKGWIVMSYYMRVTYATVQKDGQPAT
jgi:hypothetical protein